MLGDPFSAVLESRQRQQEQTQKSLMDTVGLMAKEKQRQQSLDLLKQLGIFKDKPLSIDDYKKSAEEQTGNKGGININSTLPEEKQIEIAQRLFEVSGLKPPKSKGIDVDIDRASKLGLQFNPSTGETVINPPAQKGVSIADASDLTSEQQVQARALAKKIYGVRGAEYGLPAVYNEIRKGKSVDQIEDELRYAGQSKEFTGSVRDAAQTLMINAGSEQTQRAMDYLDDYISKGDTEGVKTQLKRLAIKQAPAADQTLIVSKERTIKLLDEIQSDLNNLKKMGIDTNILSGTEEQVANKIGLVVNPEARKVATKIQTAIQNYRRGMTGVAFGQIENKEYKNMFPSISKTGELNTAIINGLKETFTGDLDNFYSLSMGDKNYKELFGKKEEKTQTQQGWTKEKETRYQELLKKRGQ